MVKKIILACLVARDGVTVKRFAPVAEPRDFEKDVEAFL